MDHRKRERERKKRGRKSIEKKRESSKSPQIKGEVNILRGEKHVNFKNSCLYDSIF
jgi:hypothetical protein